jgi:hypothetical protein
MCFVIPGIEDSKGNLLSHGRNEIGVHSATVPVWIVASKAEQSKLVVIRTQIGYNGR